MSKYFHTGVSLEALLQMDDGAIAALTHQDPKRMSAYAIELQLKGFETLPPCDHVDDKGNCLGHDDDQAQSKSKTSSLCALLVHAVARNHRQDATCAMCQELARAANILRVFPGLDALDIVFLMDALEQISAGLKQDSLLRQKIAKARKEI